ncbi:MAG: amidohydrolase family protein [Rhodococcus sp. (in: high G+C Gram-positive bacteria)]|uniref:amidohydrolase family protein n=1 Tax=Rhodococcus sp. TaxID=1831 RepID=UPI002ADAC6AA|nr:amidohydrolase family protein [Rhodococcus sp. (in: high G+C Gram-positive bacteria)]
MPTREEPLHAALPIIDSHHHLFDKAPAALAGAMGRSTFLIDEYEEYVDGPGDGTGGHNVVATVVVEALGMDGAIGPESSRWVNATAFVSGQAAMAATGRYHGIQLAAGIVGSADLRAGAQISDVLEEHIAVGNHRFRGIRQDALWDADPTVLRGFFGNPPHLYSDADFRKGFAQLATLGLSFDAFVLAPQLADVADLARAFPDTAIVLNHLGNPVGIGAHRGRLAEEFPQWRSDIADISRCDNVMVKMGGLGSFLSGSPHFRADPPADCAALAREWRPYAEQAIELFGAERVMFESNAPTDRTGAFSTICNAYKTICSGCSDSELTAIFAGTAKQFYRLDVAMERIVRSENRH